MTPMTARMRARTRRATAAGVAIATALLGMTACTSSAPNATSSAKASHFTITVPTSQAPWNPAYAKLIQAYEQDTGNKVVLRAFPNPDVKTQEVNDIQGKSNTFDVFQINEQDLVQFNENKWIQPFTDVDPTYKPDSQIYSYSNIGRWDASKKLFDSSGKYTNLPILGNVDIFMYRKDIYKKLGLSVPKTWDQVIANGKKIEAANVIKYAGVYRTQGVAGTYAATFEFQALLNSAGGAWFKQPGTNWTPTAASKAGVQAATWFRELAEQGPSATTTIGQAQAIAEMQSGDAAQTYLVAAGAAQLEDPNNSSVAGKIGYAPLPETPSGKSSAATGLWSLAIPSGLPKVRAQHALEFINWITSKSAQILFAKNGGIPVRSEAYAPSVLPTSAKAPLAVVNKTAANLPSTFTSLRYSFSTAMLNITEPGLEKIAAGTVSPEDGMRAINSQLASLVAQQKLPTG